MKQHDDTTPPTMWWNTNITNMVTHKKKKDQLNVETTIVIVQWNTNNTKPIAQKTRLIQWWNKYRTNLVTQKKRLTQQWSNNNHNPMKQCDDCTKNNHQLNNKAIARWLHRKKNINSKMKHHSQWRNTKEHLDTNENLRLKSKSSNLIPQT